VLKEGTTPIETTLGLGGVLDLVSFRARFLLLVMTPATNKAYFGIPIFDPPREAKIGLKKSGVT